MINKMINRIVSTLIGIRHNTSDLKRGPIEREIRRYLKANPQFSGKIVNCLGLRAEESSDRAKKPEVRINKANSVAGRTWLEWLPIHTLLLEEVLAVIEADGQTLHWAYDAGMSRLSCCFCIMASKKDLTTAAILNPRLYAEYVALERELGVSMLMPAKGKPQFLEDVTGIKAQPIRSSYLLPKRLPKAAA